MKNAFVHIHDYEFTTAGDVPITLQLFVSAGRNDAGEWFIEQVRVIGVVAWFDPKQGLTAEFDDPNGGRLGAAWHLEHFAMRAIRRDGDMWAKLCTRFDELEARGEVYAIA